MNGYGAAPMFAPDALRQLLPDLLQLDQAPSLRRLHLAMPTTLQLGTTQVRLLPLERKTLRLADFHWMPSLLAQTTLPSELVLVEP
jgi:hypothetical protein